VPTTPYGGGRPLRGRRGATHLSTSTPRCCAPRRRRLAASCAAGRRRGRRGRSPRTCLGRPRTQSEAPEDRASHHTCPPHHDTWQVRVVALLQVMSLLLLKARLVQVCVLLLKALLKLALSLSLSRPPTPTPLAPYSPYDARPGIYRFRGTPTAPETPRPPLSPPGVGLGPERGKLPVQTGYGPNRKAARRVRGCSGYNPV